MYSAAGLTTLIVAILVGTAVGNLVQLRYFMNNEFMRSGLVRFGSLGLGILIMIFVVPRLGDNPTTSDLLSYGLGWVIIAFLVSFVRPPTPLAPPAAKPAGTEDAAATESDPQLPESGDERRS